MPLLHPLEILTKCGIRYWRINRPSRGNSLGPTLSALLTKAMEDLQGELKLNHAVRVLVIEAKASGKHKDIWIAGGDLKELASLKSQEEGYAYASELAQLCRNLETLPIPVIAKINGAAIGGGAELALSCDLRIGSDASSFVFKQLLLGLTTGYGSARRLVQTVGLPPAKRLLFGGRKVLHEECLSLGLLTHSSGSTNKLETEVENLCQNLIQLDPRAIAIQKAMFDRAAFHLDMTENIQRELSEFSSLWMEPHHKRAIDTFEAKSKRP